MAIQTTKSAAQDFFKKADTIAPGSGKAKLDPNFFKMMLQSGYGINGEVGKSSKLTIPRENMISGLEMLAGSEASGQDAALTMLGYQTDAKGLTGGEGGLNMFQGNALATLSRIAMEQAAEDSGVTPTVPVAVPDTGSTLRRSVDKSSVRMAVNPSARHPDDLGHLGRVGQTSGRGGFTKREEELLLAVAGAENILAESNRAQAVKEQAVATRKVLPSALERKAGRLSAQYESNYEIDCIGYDSRGGTSYGQYQIASKTGAMAVARAASGEADHSRIFLAQYIRI